MITNKVYNSPQTNSIVNNITKFIDICGGIGVLHITLYNISGVIKESICKNWTIYIYDIPVM